MYPYSLTKLVVCLLTLGGGVPALATNISSGGEGPFLPTASVETGPVTANRLDIRDGVSSDTLRGKHDTEIPVLYKRGQTEN